MLRRLIQYQQMIHRLHKNGIRIFENDIIFGNMFPYPALVVFLEDRACFGWEIRVKNGTFGTFEGLMGTPEYEIVGNIYTKPELLEK